ncbi:MAG: protein-glutamate O-methyltransferase CheR [Acidobacteria bacterium]|jgi:chemotaxis protein methyltransferase CheR|nr:protein-glutamate O-methyltransferase CheR [Acidobacteriota bacterium]MBV9184425.1 protein-glutamate O-methyltransferase CheR [Acidobacteriota bacterium]
MSTFNLSLNHHLDLPDDVFRLMRDQIYKRTGMWFADTSKYLLQKRLSPRARELNFESFQKYFYFLQYDPRAEAEFDQIYDLVTTNETYFFREPAQLAAFADEIVPEILSRKTIKKIRIWSAGCSSGEEPYSIAMLLNEAGYYDRAAFEIFASDINQQVLAKARRGHYRESAFRATDGPLRDKYFTRNEDGSWHIHDDIRNRVSFGRLNLYDEPRVSLLGHLDVIFCRNVIIYFDDQSKKVVVSNFYNRLTDTGYLLLGHSESLISLSTQFKLRHLKNDMVYQK